MSGKVTCGRVDTHDRRAGEEQLRIPPLSQGIILIESKLHAHGPPCCQLMWRRLLDVMQLKSWGKHSSQELNVEHVACVHFSR